MCTLQSFIILQLGHDLFLIRFPYWVNTCTSYSLCLLCTPSSAQLVKLMIIIIRIVEWKQQQLETSFDKLGEARWWVLHLTQKLFQYVQQVMRYYTGKNRNSLLQSRAEFPIAFTLSVMKFYPILVLYKELLSCSTGNSYILPVLNHLTSKECMCRQTDRWWMHG